MARAARRFFWPGGLSSRLLILTVLFVALLGLIALPATLTQFEDRWLYDRVRAGELASLAIEVAPNQTLSDKFTREIVKGSGVVSIAVQSGGVRRLLLAGPRVAVAPYLIDLREGASPLSWTAPFETLFSGQNRMVRVIARPSFRDGDFIEIVAPDGPLKVALANYLLSLVGVAAISAVVIAGSLYLLLNLFFVLPMQRITRSMERFRADPEDASATIHPSGRRDEIGRAEAELDRMQADLRATLNARARLAALGEAVAKINHDLRNMLTSAQIASERMAQSGDPKVAQALPRLERALDRAIKLTTGVLAYGKSEEPEPTPVVLRLAPAIAAAAEDAGLTADGVCLRSTIRARRLRHRRPGAIAPDPGQPHAQRPRGDPERPRRRAQGRDRRQRERGRRSGDRALRRQRAWRVRAGSAEAVPAVRRLRPPGGRGPRPRHRPRTGAGAGRRSVARGDRAHGRRFRGAPAGRAAGG